MRFAYERQTLHLVNPNIVHIDLDDQSISSLIYDKNDPRLYTELIRVLKKTGVKAVLVDMVFPYCRKGREVYCDAFADEIGNSGNIFFPVILSNSEPQNEKNQQNNGITSAKQSIWNISDTQVFDLKHGEVTMANLESINRAAAGPSGRRRPCSQFRSVPTDI